MSGGTGTGGAAVRPAPPHPRTPAPPRRLAAEAVSGRPGRWDQAGPAKKHRPGSTG
ncbi:hypothetical protein [Streptomyces sp. NPDC088766]|uniref:hypothetical protein n=1 Tax=Streptomyces sp. NPDC088766 TaxID=3365893 RepID=UPI00380EFD25